MGINIYSTRPTFAPDLTAKVDSVVTLRINNNMKGRSLIARLFFGRIDFAVPGAIVTMHEDKFPDANRDFKTSLDKFEIVIDFEVESKQKHIQ